MKSLKVGYYTPAVLAEGTSINLIPFYFLSFEDLMTDRRSFMSHLQGKKARERKNER